MLVTLMVLMRVTITEHLPRARHCLRAFQGFCHLILQSPRDRYYCYPHLMMRKPKPTKYSTLLKALHLERSGAGIWTQHSDSKAHPPRTRFHHGAPKWAQATTSLLWRIRQFPFYNSAVPKFRHGFPWSVTFCQCEKEFTGVLSHCSLGPFSCIFCSGEKGLA